MKGTYQKVLAYIVVIVVGAMMMRGMKGDDLEGNRKFVQAFSATTFQMDGAELNMWGEYIPKYMQMEEMGAVVKEIAEVLKVTDFTTDIEESETRRTYTAKKHSKEAITTIQFVETIERIDDLTYQAKNYLVVNIILSSKCESITFFQALLSDYYNQLKIKPTIGLTVTASKAGVISEVTAKAIMTQLIAALNGEVRSISLEDQLKSAYGYTRYVENFITANGEKINMDLAVTYNELEDRTYLYGAIPVITFDY